MLVVKELSFAYQNLAIFQNFSFEIKAGEIVHLRGANGSGKSSLLNVLSGLAQPSSGSVEFAHGVVRSYLPAERNGHFLRLDAVTNLKIWTELSALNHTTEDLKAALLGWGFSEKILKLNLRVNQFSTGMKRKLALVRLVLSKSQLWLLDEPVTGLDDQAVEMFVDALRHHTECGGACLFVSHEDSVLREIASRSIDMNIWGVSR